MVYANSYTVFFYFLNSCNVTEERYKMLYIFAVRLVGKLEDGTVFVKKGHDGDEPFEFKTDEEQVIEGLDRTVVTMKKGEVVLVRIPPEQAFGSNETKLDLAVVPPNSTVFYEVELVSFEKVTITTFFLVYLSFSLMLICYGLRT